MLCVFKKYPVYIWPAHQTVTQSLCVMPTRWKAFTLSNSFQDPAASETADVPLKRQKLKDTKLQTQSLQEQISKTAGCSTWLSCDMSEYKCKYRSELKRHLAHVHDIDVIWFSCNMCGYKCKQRSHLKTHLAHVHDIDVQWFSCDKCDYKCKHRGTFVPWAHREEA